MIFHRYATAALLASTFAPHAVATASCEAELARIQEQLLELKSEQQKQLLEQAQTIGNLKSSIDALTAERIHGDVGNSIIKGTGVLRAKNGNGAGNHRNLSYYKSKSKGKGKSKGESEKKKPDETKICYSKGGQIGKYVVKEKPTFPNLERASLDFGTLYVNDYESIKIEVSVTSLLIEAKGGVIKEDPSGDSPKIYAVGSGIVMYPILRRCNIGCYHSYGKKPMYKPDACPYGKIIKPEPSPVLPVDIAVIGGYNRLLNKGEQEKRKGRKPRYEYEILGQLELSTTTGKFYFPSSDLGCGYYHLDFAFVTAHGGINIDLGRFEIPDWTLSGAFLGPHIIEVSKMKSDDEVCYYDDIFPDPEFEGSEVQDIMFDPVEQGVQNMFNRVP